MRRAGWISVSASANTAKVQTMNYEWDENKIVWSTPCVTL
jgi:hypothetical protein